MGTRPAAGPAPHLRFHSVNIYVRDQERALRFYVDQLGFHAVFDVRLQSGERWVAVAPPDGTAILALVAPKPESKEYALIGRTTHITFITEDVPSKVREWTKRGVRFPTPPRLRRIKYDSPQSPPQGANADDSSVPLGKKTPIWGGAFARFQDIDRNTFLLVSFDEVTQALEAQRRAAAEKLEADRRTAQELEIAKRVQARLFPQNSPALRTLDYAGVCIQARQVGGDYYDFLDLGANRLALVVGDVAGKGIAAALLMANLQANLRSQCGIAADHLQRLLCSVNQLFCDNTAEGAFATLFFADYDDNSGRLRFANCGHLPALLRRSDGALERLDSTSTVLGLFKDWDCMVGECQVRPGDTFALYTDGITEAFNSSGEEYGEGRLAQALQRNCELPAQSLLTSIVDEVRAFMPHEQRDDITLIVAKCRNAADEARA
jgi:serine phosphatase RsbU (regulator of sigma subunit)/predicted enzyme related to lactoylglutathione lyase